MYSKLTLGFLSFKNKVQIEYRVSSSSAILKIFTGFPQLVECRQFPQVLPDSWYILHLVQVVGIKLKLITNYITYKVNSKSQRNNQQLFRKVKNSSDPQVDIWTYYPSQKRRRHLSISYLLHPPTHRKFKRRNLLRSILARCISFHRTEIFSYQILCFLDFSNFGRALKWTLVCGFPKHPVRQFPWWLYHLKYINAKQNRVYHRIYKKWWSQNLDKKWTKKSNIGRNG